MHLTVRLTLTHNPTQNPTPADIRLEAPIHDTLHANYVGSLAMVNLAARMTRLRSFTYISTCYTNMNRPRGTHVEEK